MHPAPRISVLVSGLAACFVASVIGGAAAQQADPRSPYTDAIIDRVEARSVPSLRGILYENLMPALSRSERADLSDVTFEAPRRISPWRPFSVWSDSHQRKIVFPMETIRFLDDLFIVATALNRAKCDIRWVGIYSGMLTRKAPPDSGRFPDPISAFGLDRDRLLSDPQVDDYSGLHLKTAVAFILGHELGHVALAHRVVGDAQDSRQRERDADAYALRIHRLLGAPPLGAATLFTMVGHAFLGAGDFPDYASFEASFKEEGTHPLDGERLRAIGAEIESSASLFARNEPNPQSALVDMLQLAQEFNTLGRLLDDNDVRLLQADTSRTTSWSDLKSVCPALAE